MQPSQDVNYPQRDRTFTAIKPTLVEMIFAIATLALVALAIDFKILQDGVIFGTHDLHIHLKWLQFFSQQLSEGSLYPRWLGGLNFGYGSPTFVFYPPAVMYLGSAIKALGLNAERAMAILILLATFVAGFGFYLFGRSRWRCVPAVCGAIAYMSAPYMIYNVYHRGAIAEVLATSLLPFGLLFTDQLMRQGKRWLALTLCFAALSLTHLPSLLLYVIAWAIYVISNIVIQRLSFKRMFHLMAAPIMGFGLSSFYLIPAVLEKKLVNLDYMRRVSGGFAANFLPLVGAPQEGLSGHLISMFRYGVASTVVCMTIATVLGMWFSRSAKGALIQRALLWLVSLAIVGFLMTFAAHSLWAASPTLQMVQFPWRLMGLFALIYAGSFGLAVESLWYFWTWKKPAYGWLAAGLLLCLLAWNIKYSYVLSTRYHGFYVPGDIAAARAEHSWQATSYDRVSLILSDPFSNQLGDVAEYLPLLPNSEVVARPLRAQPPVTVAKGQVVVTLDQWKGDYRQLSVAVRQPSELHVRTYNYPAWHAYINGKGTPIQTTSGGLIGLTLEPGDYSIELRYQATAAMKLGGAFSLLSLLVVTYVLVGMTRKNKFQLR